MSNMDIDEPLGDFAGDGNALLPFEDEELVDVDDEHTQNGSTHTGGDGQLLTEQHDPLGGYPNPDRVREFLAGSTGAAGTAAFPLLLGNTLSPTEVSEPLDNRTPLTPSRALDDPPNGSAGGPPNVVPGGPLQAPLGGSPNGPFGSPPNGPSNGPPNGPPNDPPNGPPNGPPDGPALAPPNPPRDGDPGRPLSTSSNPPLGARGAGPAPPPPPPPGAFVATSLLVKPKAIAPGTVAPLPRELAEVWAPWSFKIYELDDSTKHSARDEAHRIVHSLGPIYATPNPFSGSTNPIRVPLDKLIFDNANKASDRKDSTAMVSFSANDLEYGRVSQDCLAAVLLACENAGYECHFATAQGNDRLTALNYEIRPPLGVEIDSKLISKLTKTVADTTLESVFTKERCTLAHKWNWQRDRSTGIMTGACAETRPFRAKRLAEKSPFVLDNGYRVSFSRPRFIQPHYFTALALYIGDDACTSDDTYRLGLEELAKEYEQKFNVKVGIGEPGLSDDGRFFLFEPSEAHFATYLCQMPQGNGFFCERVYDLNEQSSNFNRKNIHERRLALLRKYQETERFAERIEDREAIEALILSSEKRTDGKLNVLAAGTANGFRMMLERDRTRDLAILQSEERSLVRKIRDLASQNDHSPAAQEKRRRLDEDLKVVKGQILKKTNTRGVPDQSLAASNPFMAGFTLSDPAPPSRIEPAFTFRASHRPTALRLNQPGPSNFFGNPNVSSPLKRKDRSGGAEQPIRGGPRRGDPAV